MKNYNKILEAVNRGIQLALDDFDDEEPIKNIKSKQVQNRDYTKEYLDLMEEVVDFGLPSKTLWCKYNLDVDPNQLTKPEDWYGKYYAWGETKSDKPKYDMESYIFGNGSGRTDEITKYVTSEDFVCNPFNDDSEILTQIDNLTQLLPEDDAAYQFKKCHNFKFHIPTKEQLEELKNYTNNYWVNNYNPNKIKHNPEDDGGIQGLNGRVFEGKNTNQLFIPAAGFCDDDKRYNIGTSGYLWSKLLYASNPKYAYKLAFDLFDIDTYVDSRYSGFSIRPVINL